MSFEPVSHSWVSFGLQSTSPVPTCCECADQRQAERAVRHCGACDDTFCEPCYLAVHAHGRRRQHEWEPLYSSPAAPAEFAVVEIPTFAKQGALSSKGTVGSGGQLRYEGSGVKSTPVNVNDVAVDSGDNDIEEQKNDRTVIDPPQKSTAVFLSWCLPRNTNGSEVIGFQLQQRTKPIAMGAVDEIEDVLSTDRRDQELVSADEEYEESLLKAESDLDQAKCDPILDQPL